MRAYVYNILLALACFWGYLGIPEIYVGEVQASDVYGYISFQPKFPSLCDAIVSLQFFSDINCCDVHISCCDVHISSSGCVVYTTPVQSVVIISVHRNLSMCKV